ncbi:hypothetical protein GJA_2708 [Janthinobacterium agaricidamnosum NBRC 102515 = DSM 9628]|uniref:Uncharacterized protein n=1 Tax=Janthinobacterium agaricidamnosum NBRC 102515 = DSM 9628 TaxID=1349767 RepID=W0V3D1_9BURK|nr:hypothetical protein GJA_2708 [Janthinobacterium agaricidamnosum NBRC 102515 = DSM 9628]
MRLSYRHADVALRKGDGHARDIGAMKKQLAVMRSQAVI